MTATESHDQVPDSVRDAVYRAVMGMTLAEVRELVMDPYLEIRRNGVVYSDDSCEHVEYTMTLPGLSSLGIEELYDYRWMETSE